MLIAYRTNFIYVESQHISKSRYFVVFGQNQPNPCVTKITPNRSPCQPPTSLRRSELLEALVGALEIKSQGANILTR